MSYSQAYFTFYDRRGNKLETTTDVVNATWIRTTNAIGSAVVDIDATCYDFETYTQEDLSMLIEVVDGKGQPKPDLDTLWLLRGFDENRQNDLEVLSLQFEDSMSLLNRRIVSLRADTPEGSEPRTNLAGPANVIMAEIFDTVTTLASFGRDWSANVSLAPIANPAPFVEKEVPWKNLLQVMQQIARASRDKGVPLFFDMIFVPPYNFQFTTYIDQRGKAHSVPINSSNPYFLLDRFSANYNAVPNSSYVGGAGRGQSRKLGFAQQAKSGPFWVYERFKSTNLSNQQALDDEAAEMINGGAGIYSLAGMLIGDLAKEYTFGDRVEVQHRDFTLDCEISTIRTTLANKVLERDIIVRSR